MPSILILPILLSPSTHTERNASRPTTAMAARTSVKIITYLNKSKESLVLSIITIEATYIYHLFLHPHRAECEPGHYSYGGQKECSYCEEGYYCPSTTEGPYSCASGWYSEAKSTNCTICEAGYACLYPEGVYKIAVIFL